MGNIEFQTAEQLRQALGIRELTWKDGALMVAAVAGAFAISKIFAGYIEVKHENDKTAGYDGWFVAEGMGYTSVAVFVVLGLLMGWAQALTATLTMLVVSLISLIPMIQYDMRQSERKRKALEAKAEEAAMLKRAQEENEYAG